MISRKVEKLPRAVTVGDARGCLRTGGHPDYHRRRGVQAIFCFLDPNRGRRVTAQSSRTRFDWAGEIRRLEVDYASAEVVTVV